MEKRTLMSRSATERPGALRGHGALRMAPGHGALRGTERSGSLRSGYIVCGYWHITSKNSWYWVYITEKT